MSALDHPNVRKDGEYYYVVTTDDGDTFDVSADQPDEWWVGNPIGSKSCREANLKSRQDAEVWAKQTTHGPFGTAERAVQWVLDGAR